MPMLTAPAIDLDAAALLLVAEVESYLRSVAPAASVSGPLNLARLLAATPPANPHGSTVQPWHAHLPQPRPSVTDRLLRRRPVTDVTVSQHLDLVSRYIAHHGWLQGALWDDRGRVCVLGAQLRVLAAGYGTADTARRARQRLGNELGRLGRPLPVDTWNDLPTTTRHDVHRLLERAADQR